MEDQKNMTKEIKMQSAAQNQGNTEAQKLTYDQLKDAADKLWNENRYLRQQNAQLTQFANTVNRLDYLFRIVEIAHNNRSNSVSFASEFVEECIDEIQKAMVIPQEAQASENNKEN
jgi:hypothetical protein